MDHPTTTPEERYDRLVEALVGNEGVTQSSKRGFGSSALWIRGKIFAMLANGSLVVKLPKSRVDALVAAGAGERFDPRHDGRLMKEWLVVSSTSDEEWLTLAREAMGFVAGG
jgi:TfoX/Sxy family transcriptional regulator of competence genes